MYQPLHQVAGEDIRPYFLENKHFAKETYNFPYNVSPLTFLDYDEKTIFEKVKSIGWKRPEGIDAKTTNCLLNSFANVVHNAKHKFHPYAFEMAKLVREGYMEREESLRKLTEPENADTVEWARKKLFC